MSRRRGNCCNKYASGCERIGLSWCSRAFRYPYIDAVGETFEPHGGRVLFRGAKEALLNGDAPGESVEVAEFADRTALMNWHDSPAYQALIALRGAGAEVVLTAYRA